MYAMRKPDNGGKPDGILSTVYCALCGDETFGPNLDVLWEGRAASREEWLFVVEKKSKNEFIIGFVFQERRKV